MKKIISFIIILILSFCCAIAIDSNHSVDVLIYSSMEDYRNSQLSKMLKEKFPSYNIKLQYMSTGNCASKIKAEKAKTAVDIVVDLEYSYCNMLQESFAYLSFIDTSIYKEDFIVSEKFVPFNKASVAIVINQTQLQEKKLPIPKNYEDLLNPIYKNSIIMPNPKTSGTAYSFLKGILNLYGEKQGWEYFDKLHKNIIAYTSSGSGPISSLALGEACIGVCMVGQATNLINNGNDYLKILNFDQGVSYTLTGNAIISGKEKNQKVKDVFSFIQKDYNLYEKEKFFPENIYKKDLSFNIPNFPKLKPMDMAGLESIEIKEEILKLWKY